MKFALSFLTVAVWLLTSPALAAKPDDFDRQIREFVNDMSARHGWSEPELQATMDGIQFRQNIIDAISRPAEAKPWHQYRPIFVTEKRAQEGLAFWQTNRALLERAEQEYGVPPEIVVAIIGVETRYGRHQGKHQVLDALATLAFGYPKRSRFFRRELEHFLLLSREEQLEPRATLGSYAGAMGKPQFIASSYRRYAVDFDGDGRRDLLHNTADAIGSVAAYFKHHGWQRGQPVTSQVAGSGPKHREFAAAGIKPSLTVGELLAAGIVPELSLPADAECSLVELETGNGKAYWLGLDNFYVITRYNHSKLYAMAVYQLSRKIAALQAQQSK